MSREAELGQYFCTTTQFKKSENSLGVEPPNPHTPNTPS